jgi:hypothetical protein
MKSKKYESYLDETISRNLKSMISSIVNADVMLSFVIDNENITREQVDELYFEYHEFAYSVQELEQMYIRVKDKQSMFNPVNQYHFELYQFFEHLKTEMDTTEQNIRKLSEEELVYYRRLFRLTETYTDTLQKYRKSKLKAGEEEWVKLLNNLSNVDNSGIIKENKALTL